MLTMKLENVMMFVCVNVGIYHKLIVSTREVVLCRVFDYYLKPQATPGTSARSLYFVVCLLGSVVLADKAGRRVLLMISR